MSVTKSEALQVEIHTAEIDRSLALVSQVWESNTELSVDEMCKHLEAIGNIVDKTSDYSTFVTETNLSGLERLN